MTGKTSLSAAIAVCLLMGFSSNLTSAKEGKISQKISEIQNSAVFTEFAPFDVQPATGEGLVPATLTKYSLVKPNSDFQTILDKKPNQIRLKIPFGNETLSLLLYKAEISPAGLTVLTSDGRSEKTGLTVVHYRGILEGHPDAIASFSFSKEAPMGLILTHEGNINIGPLEKDDAHQIIIFNDREIKNVNPFDCSQLPVPASPSNGGSQLGVTSTKCVNWYWETDYDVFTNKGSSANVNAYMQGVFNQDATLYANDGISINLQTLYIWTTNDPFTGPSTSDYLTQFGNIRTSFAGDLAHLVGFNGNGGIAWVGGLCMSNMKYHQAYSGINSTYQNVPVYSWTIEVIAHEEGHLLGSQHTHDCAWNGNNTPIDGCGPTAGYGSGSCAIGPVPVKGTIMSYCHLLSGVGIDLTLGFGPQPTTLILNKVNNSACLSACTGSPCTVPVQPGTISGNATICGGTPQSYSITAVSGATSYIWTLPSGWSGSSSSNTINVTAGTSGGTISVVAVNSCGNSTARTLAVSTSGTAPQQPGAISGLTAVCPSSNVTYSIAAVNGATSYSWTLPSGWYGSSSTNSITVNSGTTGGTISVRAVSSCGTSTPSSVTVSTSGTAPAQPGSINGITTACPGTTNTYSVAAVSGAISYNWTLPSGWSGSSSSNSITVTSGTTGGTISVSAVNTCGTGLPRTLSVAVGGTALQQPGAISVSGGIAQVCPGDVRTYTTAAISGVTFTWTAPAGATITSGQGTNTIQVSFNSAFVSGTSLSVTCQNSCGTSTARTLAISRNVPATPGAMTGLDYGLCGKTNVSYTVPLVSGVTYNWTVPAGATVVSGQGTNTVTVNFPSVNLSANISVVATNGCGSSAARTRAVKTTPDKPSAISGPTTVCPKSAGNQYTLTPVQGATSYTWSGPSGSKISDGILNSNGSTLTTTASSVAFKFGSLNPTFSIYAKANNGCGSGNNAVLTVTRGNCRTGDELENDNELLLYPNPASSNMTLKLNSTAEESGELRITDISGKVVLNQKIQLQEGSNTLNLNIETFAKGLYVVSVETPGKIIHQKAEFN